MYSSLSISKHIESLWRTTGTWSDYVEAMRMALVSAPPASPQAQTKHQPWILLPSLCCQAAGGEPYWAESVAAAWGLLYTAAHLLDSVEDNDRPEAWWVQLGPGVAINIAIGLFASALLALSNLRQQGFAENVVTSITDEFYHGLLKSCCGQHRDLTHTELSLEASWQVIEAKSGTVFAVACKTGARLATEDQERLRLYSQFGYHLGVLIQIGNDVSCLWAKNGTPNDLRSGSKWTLPIAYAMAVSSPEVRAQLGKYLKTASQDPAAEIEARHLIKAAGAMLYLSVEAERHRQQAKYALEKACPPSAVRDELIALLNEIIPLSAE